MSTQSIELIRKLSVDLQHRAVEIETIFDMLPVGITIADDPACRTIRFNRAFAELVGLKAARSRRRSTPGSTTPPSRCRKTAGRSRPKHGRCAWPRSKAARSTASSSTCSGPMAGG